MSPRTLQVKLLKSSVDVSGRHQQWAPSTRVARRNGYTITETHLLAFDTSNFSRAFRR